MKKFYKTVDVVEHPESANLAKLSTDSKVSLQNLSQSKDVYYAVTLDNRVTKTLYQDTLALPSRALAVAIAEEWASQADVIDTKTLKLSQIMAKACRTAKDPSLITYMKQQLFTILSND